MKVVFKDLCTLCCVISSSITRPWLQTIVKPASLYTSKALLERSICSSFNSLMLNGVQGVIR